jgi:crotonobetainyl-CoA:carnitine CoA-transferase CaiB-like acyl-CoA transferase
MKALATYEHPKAGTVKVVAPAVKMSETPATIDRPAPMVGEHTAEILAEFGYGPDEIRALAEKGSVAVGE